MTPNYLVIAHGPVASGAQTLLNKQYLAVSKAIPLVLRNTYRVDRPAVDSAAPQEGVAPLYCYPIATGFTSIPNWPIVTKSPSDGS